MTAKIPLVSIGVKRDGKTIHPEIGKVFDFTDDEIADVDKLSAATGVDYFRDPVNETIVDAAPAKKAATAKPKGSDL